MRNNYEPELTYPVFVGGRLRELTQPQAEAYARSRLSPIDQLALRVTELEEQVRQLRRAS